MDHEQTSYNRQLEEVVKARDLLHKESNHFREMNERSEISIRLHVTDVQTLHHQLTAAPDNTEYPKNQVLHQKQQSFQCQLLLSMPQWLADG